MNRNTCKLIRKAFTLLGVKNFSDLSKTYSREDQKLMKSGKWNTHNSDLIINKVKVILEQIDSNDLSKLDRMWCMEILWFWYHHAVSYAIWQAKDKTLAQVYASTALELQGDKHPNRITKLLWFLVHDRVNEKPEKF